MWRPEEASHGCRQRHTDQARWGGEARAREVRPGSKGGRGVSRGAEQGSCDFIWRHVCCLTRTTLSLSGQPSLPWAPITDTQALRAASWEGPAGTSTRDDLSILPNCLLQTPYSKPKSNCLPPAPRKEGQRRSWAPSHTRASARSLSFRGVPWSPPFRAHHRFIVSPLPPHPNRPQRLVSEFILRRMPEMSFKIHFITWLPDTSR